MHRYLARFIGCAVIGLALSLLQFVTPHQGAKVITVRTDGKTADVVAAVEALGRSDLTIKISEETWTSQPVISTVFGTLAFAGVMWCVFGFVKRVEATYSGDKK